MSGYPKGGKLAKGFVLLPKVAPDQKTKFDNPRVYYCERRKVWWFRWLRWNMASCHYPPVTVHGTNVMCTGVAKVVRDGALTSALLVGGEEAVRAILDQRLGAGRWDEG